MDEIDTKVDVKEFVLESTKEKLDVAKNSKEDILVDQPDVEKVLRIETNYSNPVVKLNNAKTLGRPWRLNQDVQDSVKNYLDDINAEEEQKSGNYKNDESSVGCD